MLYRIHVIQYIYNKYAISQPLVKGPLLDPAEALVTHPSWPMVSAVEQSADSTLRASASTVFCFFLR